MLVGRIDKEEADISRVIVDMAWWLDAAETITTVVSQEVILGMSGWSEAPYPPPDSPLPFDPFPLEIKSIEIQPDGRTLELFVELGSAGLAYTCEFVLDGSSTRRVTIQVGVQLKGVPISSQGSGPLPSYLAVTISDTPPSDPQAGQLWFDSGDPQLYIWYDDPSSAQWVIVTANSGGLSTDAPLDSQYYARFNSSWRAFIPGFLDSPLNTTTYGRRNGGWNPVLPASGGALTGGGTITNVPTPVNLSDAAPKSYVDLFATGSIVSVGNWNAATNTPTVTSSNGSAVGNVAGRALLVSVAGSTSINGNSTWVVGDSIVWSGSVWFRAAYGSTYALADSGTITNPTITGATRVGFSSGDLLVPEYRMAGVSAYFADVLGNVGPHVATDGTFMFGTVNLKEVVGAGVNASTVPVTVKSVGFSDTSLQKLADPRVTTPVLSVTDQLGNVCAYWDSTGEFHAAVTPPSSTASFTIGNVFMGPMDPRMPDTTYDWTDSVGQGGLAVTATGRAAFTPALGVLTDAVQRVVKRQTIMTQCAHNQATTVYDEASGTTFHAMMTLDTQGFDAVRLIFVSDNGPGAPFNTTISAKVAVSAQPGDFFNPVDPVGAPAAWKTVTFNNNGLDVAWDKQAGGSKVAQTVLPARTTSSMDGTTQGNLIAYTLSDWIPISSYDRVDANARFPILMVRMFGTGTPTVRARNNPQSTEFFNNQVGDRHWRLHSALGDFMTDPTTFPLPAGGAINGNTVLLGVQYYSRSRGVSVLNIGDSIAGGTGGGPAGIDWAVRACLALSTPQSPIGYFIAPTGIITGTGPQAFMTNAETTFDWMQPNICCFEAMSRNWPVTRDHVDTLWQHYMMMAARLDKIGGLPIWSDPGPNSSMVEATEPFRLDMVHRCIQAGLGGHFRQRNNEGELVTGTVPVDTFATYYSDDNLHPNGHGHDAYAAVMIRHLLAAIGGVNP